MIHLQVGQTSIHEQLGEKAETGRATKAQIVSLLRVFIKEGTFCPEGVLYQLLLSQKAR
jgi:hypothetical protein